VKMASPPSRADIHCIQPQTEDFSHDLLFQCLHMTGTFPFTFQPAASSAEPLTGEASISVPIGIVVDF
jgi:hypothetical protein